MGTEKVELVPGFERRFRSEENTASQGGKLAHTNIWRWECPWLPWKKDLKRLHLKS